MSLDTVHTEDNDIETQPLLSHLDISNSNITKQKKRYQRYLDRLKPHCTSYLPRFFFFFFFFLLFFVLLLIFFIPIRETFDKLIPSNEAIQSNILEITEFDIDQINIDGWKSIKSNSKNKYDLPDGKYLQLSCNLQTYLNYDLTSQSSIPFTPQQASWFKYINENVIRTICISVNNVTTFGQQTDWDSSKDSKSTLGSLFILEPICLNLHNGTINFLNLTLLLKPDIKNGIKVLKKIWNHDYSDLRLWSIVNMSLSKQITFIGQSMPLWRLHNLRINWNWDRKINWDKFYKGVKFFRSNFLEEITFKDIKMVDTIKGFHIQSTITQKLNNEWTKFLQKKLPWLNNPFKDDSIYIPSLEWDARLPDCRNSFTIELTNVKSYTDNYNISKDSLTTNMNIDMVGKLPDPLVKELCDETNFFTPLTKILNHLFNDTESIRFQIYGKVKDINNNDKLSNNLIPNDVLDNVFHELSYIEVGQNMTFNVSKSIKDFMIDNMQLLWKNGRLSVTGTVIGFIDFSFYHTNLERFRINKIKGNLELYHNEKHFISLPMRNWIPAKSQIIHKNNGNKNKNDSVKNSTLLKVQFDINDDDMDILNKFELSKCFNEILFKGETSIKFDSILDINIESLLGEIVLMGLATSGDTLVH